MSKIKVFCMIEEKIALVRSKLGLDKKEIIEQEESDETILTLPDVYDVYPNERQWEVFKKYGQTAAVTDVGILTGARYSNDYTVPDLEEVEKARTSAYCTVNAHNNTGYGSCIDSDGMPRFYRPTKREGTLRPILKSKKIFEYVYPKRVQGYNGVEEVQFGEYPQYAPDIETEIELEDAYLEGSLKTTGRTYTFDRSRINCERQGFQPVTYEEYEYEGKGYIRMRANQSSTLQKLCNGEVSKTGEYVWVEVAPVTWLIDNQKHRLISKLGLLAGIRYDKDEYGYKGYFRDTDVFEFMNKHMLRDILQSEPLFYARETISKEEDEQKAITR